MDQKKDQQDVGELDELSLLLADTPMKKLRARERDANKAAAVRGKGWSLAFNERETLSSSPLIRPETSGPA